MTFRLPALRVVPDQAEPVGEDFTISSPEGLVAPSTITIDEATDRAFKKLGWPRIGGPSGMGWSMWSIAERCAELFYQRFDAPEAEVGALARPKWHPEPLQIGALFHTLSGLFYAGGFGAATILPDRGGLLAPSINSGARRRKVWDVPPSAADDFLHELKQMCNQPGENVEAPALPIVLEAERLFDVHTAYWADGNEDVEPLGVEVFARHPELPYTCRYDMIGRVGANDKLLPAGVVIFERKTARYVDQKYIDSWTIDGEIMGQLLTWQASGAEARFGKLAALCVDVVTKGRFPEVRRIVIPPTRPPVDRFRRWIQHRAAQVALWRATNVYPQSFGNCYGRYGRCELFSQCSLEVR